MGERGRDAELVSDPPVAEPLAAEPDHGGAVHLRRRTPHPLPQGSRPSESDPDPFPVEPALEPAYGLHDLKHQIAIPGRRVDLLV